MIGKIPAEAAICLNTLWYPVLQLPEQTYFFLLHVTTTPSVSYVVRTEGFHCGIMISASHNPYYDNGIKVINEKGEKLEEAVITEIERYLDGKMEELLLQRGI